MLPLRSCNNHIQTSSLVTGTLICFGASGPGSSQEESQRVATKTSQGFWAQRLQKSTSLGQRRSQRPRHSPRLGHPAWGSGSQGGTSASSPSHLCLGVTQPQAPSGPHRPISKPPLPHLHPLQMFSWPFWPPSLFPLATTTISPQSRNSWGGGPML